MTKEIVKVDIRGRPEKVVEERFRYVELEEPGPNRSSGLRVSMRADIWQGTLDLTGRI
jgi:hypothetical protein